MNPFETWPIVSAVLAMMSCFLKMESMRTKARPDAKNFAEVLHQEFPLGTATVCRGTQAALAEKNPKCFEAVALIIDKYQSLNG